MAKEEETDFEGTQAENERAHTNAHAAEYEMPPLHKAYWAKYHLTEQQGKAVQEILNRYVSEELQPMIDHDELDDDGRADVQKDIDYITGLAKLFD